MLGRVLTRACSLSIGLCLLSAFFTPLTASAAGTSFNIQISPLPIELAAKPGTSVSSQLRVRNSGSQDEELKITLQAVSQKGPSGQIALNNFSSNNPLPSWVHFSKTVFDAPAGEWQTINMTVNLPKTAAYGYYYAVQFQLANPVKEQPDKAAIQGATDIFVLLNAQAPGEVAQAQILNFSTDHKSYEFLPVNFNLQMHNSGNINVAPHGNIFIDHGKTQVDSITVNSTLGSILPGSDRIFTSTWDDGFPSYKPILDVNGQTEPNGKGGIKQSLTWNFSQVPKLRFGHYTAHLVMIYNNGQMDIPVTATVSFWVIPWRILIVFLVVGVFVFIGLMSTFKKFKHRFKKFRKGPPKNAPHRKPDIQ
jgi:hypothetical protein